MWLAATSDLHTALLYSVGIFGVELLIAAIVTSKFTDFSLSMDCIHTHTAIEVHTKFYGVSKKIAH